MGEAVPLGVPKASENARPSDLAFLFHLRRVCASPRLGKQPRGTFGQSLPDTDGQRACSRTTSANPPVLWQRSARSGKCLKLRDSGKDRVDGIYHFSDTGVRGPSFLHWPGRWTLTRRGDPHPLPRAPACRSCSGLIGFRARRFRNVGEINAHSDPCPRSGRLRRRRLPGLVDMSDGLAPMPPRFLRGDEPFRGSGVTGSLRVKDYWRWSASSLMDNTARGILGEFLVATALEEYVRDQPRVEWDPYDFVARIGGRRVTIEVKSSAKVQSWKQTKHSALQFGIAPSRKWNPETGKYGDEADRADIYVFCALVETNIGDHLDVLDIDNWRFRVVRRSALPVRQKSITWTRLGQLPGKPCGFGRLGGDRGRSNPGGKLARISHQAASRRQKSSWFQEVDRDAIDRAGVSVRFSRDLLVRTLLRFICAGPMAKGW